MDDAYTDVEINPFAVSSDKERLVSSQKSSRVELDFLDSMVWANSELKSLDQERGLGNLFIGSWNVEQYIPRIVASSDDVLNLSGWFADRSNGTRKSAPDIVVIGLQEVHNPLYTLFPMAYDVGPKEVEDLVLNRIPRTLLDRSTFTGSMDCYIRRRWVPHILVNLERSFCESKGGLPEAFSYYPLFVSRHIGRGLLVFARTTQQPFLAASELRSGRTGCGLFGVYGNKGAICCGLQLHCSDLNDENLGANLAKRRLSLSNSASLNARKDAKLSVAFVNVHLAAHHQFGAYLSRNGECKYLLESMVLWPVESKLYSRLGLFAEQATVSEHKSYSTLADYDVVVLLGDTNYRLSAYSPSLLKSMDDVDQVRLSFLTLENKFLEQWAWICKRIGERNISELLKIDECRRERLAVDGVLTRFNEAPITFLPSYKFIRDSSRRLFRSETPYVPVPDNFNLGASEQGSSKAFSAKEDLGKQHAGEPVAKSKALKSHASLAELRVGSRKSLEFDKTVEQAPVEDRDPIAEYSIKRLPAYCDRILYYNSLSQTASRYNLSHVVGEDDSANGSGHSVTCSGYDTADSVCYSDHKPVSLLLKLNMATLLHRKLGRLTVYTGRDDADRSKSPESCTSPPSLCLVQPRTLWQCRALQLQRLLLHNQVFCYIAALFLIILFIGR